jgi:hypothetical protein
MVECGAYVSSTVKLEDHLGHKATVAGTAKENRRLRQKRKRRKEKLRMPPKEEYRDLSVTSLKMIGNTCAK